MCVISFDQKHPKPTLDHMRVKYPSFNPSTPNICLVTLPSSFCTFLCMLVKRIWGYIKTISPVDNYLYSHHLSALKSFIIIREVKFGSLLGVKGLSLFPSPNINYHLKIYEKYI